MLNYRQNEPFWSFIKIHTRQKIDFFVLKKLTFCAFYKMKSHFNNKKDTINKYSVF